VLFATQQAFQPFDFERLRRQGHYVLLLPHPCAWTAGASGGGCDHCGGPPADQGGGGGGGGSGGGGGGQWFVCAGCGVARYCSARCCVLATVGVPSHSVLCRTLASATEHLRTPALRPDSEGGARRRGRSASKPGRARGRLGLRRQAREGAGLARDQGGRAGHGCWPTEAVSVGPEMLLNPKLLRLLGN
jgi:hypothetical protein